MNIKKTVSNLADPSAIIQAAFETIVAEAQLTVGAVLVNVGTPPAGTSYSYILINRSAAAQVIRIGLAPSFAPVAGLSLNVGEVLILNAFTTAINAIASAPGALLDVLVATP